MSYLTNVLIGLDQLANTLIGGKPDETISAKAHREALNGKRGWVVIKSIINTLFSDPLHCYTSYRAELERTQISEEYRRDSRKNTNWEID